MENNFIYDVDPQHANRRQLINEVIMIVLHGCETHFCSHASPLAPLTPSHHPLTLYPAPINESSETHYHSSRTPHNVMSTQEHWWTFFSLFLNDDPTWERCGVCKWEEREKGGTNLPWCGPPSLPPSPLLLPLPTCLPLPLPFAFLFTLCQFVGPNETAKG